MTYFNWLKTHTLPNSWFVILRGIWWNWGFFKVYIPKISDILIFPLLLFHKSEKCHLHICCILAEAPII